MFHCSAAASVSPLELASSDIQVPRPARAFLPIPSMVGATLPPPDTLAVGGELEIVEAGSSHSCT
jgi:hypothetical protein